MLVALAACGGSATQTEKSASDSSQKSTSDSSAKQTTTGTSTEDDKSLITFDVFINHTWYSVDKFEGIIPEEITRRTGVTLNPTIAVDDQQLGLMIASGDLPDLVYTATLLDRLSTSTLCYSYNELIEEYVPDWEPTTFQIACARSFSQDDKYYTIVNHATVKEDWENVNAVPMLPSLIYRLDILEELGNPPMNTLDDLLNIYELVKQNYPDMVPLVFSDSWRFQVFKVWTGAINIDFIEQDGKVVSTIHGEKYRDYLKYLNTLYRRGYIIADNFAWTSATNPRYLENGKAFSSSGCTQDNAYPAQVKLRSVVPNGHLVESKPLGATDYSQSAIGWSGTFITKNCHNPERAIKFMRWMFTEEAQKLTQWGREGIEYTLNEQGLPVFSEEWMEAAKDREFHNTKYNPWFYFGGSGKIESLGRCASIDPEEYSKYYLDVYKQIRDGFDNKPWILASRPTEGMDEKVILDKLQDLIINMEAKIILSNSDEEFDKNFEDLQKQADQIGVAKLEEYMTKKLPEIKALFGV